MNVTENRTQEHMFKTAAVDMVPVSFEPYALSGD